MRESVRINFDVPNEFREQIKTEAKKYGMTSAQFCRMSILRSLQQGGGEIGRQEQKATL